MNVDDTDIQSIASHIHSFTDRQTLITLARCIVRYVTCSNSVLHAQSQRTHRPNYMYVIHHHLSVLLLMSHHHRSVAMSTDSRQTDRTAQRISRKHQITDFQNSCRRLIAWLACVKCRVCLLMIVTDRQLCTESLA